MSKSTQIALVYVLIVLSAHTQYSFSEGLYFLNSKQPGLPQLPPNVFVAAEATAWVKQNVDGVKATFDAIKLMQVCDLLSFATAADTANGCRTHSNCIICSGNFTVITHVDTLIGYHANHSLRQKLNLDSLHA